MIKGSEQDPGANLVEQATQSVSDTAKAVQESTQALLPQELRQPGPGEWNLGSAGLAAGVLLAAVLLRGLALWLLSKLSPLVRRSGRELDHKLLGLARRSASYGLLLAGLFIALSMARLPTKPTDYHSWAWQLFLTLAVFAAALLLYNLGDLLFTFLAGPLRSNAALLDRQILPLLRDVLKAALLVLAIAALVQTWGYNVTTLLAGVGLGGLAIAFAAQDTIANVFGSLTIYTDRPFRVGDWVQVGDVEGTVEEIGIRTTRIRRFDRAIVSVPNKSVSGLNIQNNSAMTQRRIRLTLTLAYATPAPQLALALEAIRTLIAADVRISPDSASVSLEQFSPGGVDVLVLCFTHSTDWATFVAVRTELMLAILAQLEALGVAVAEQYAAGRAATAISQLR